MSGEKMSGVERAAHFTATLVESRKAGIALTPEYVEELASLHGVPSPTLEGDNTPAGRAARASRAKVRAAEARAVERAEAERAEAERAAKVEREQEAARAKARHVHACGVLGISPDSSAEEFAAGFIQARELAAFQLSASPDVRVGIDAVARAHGLDPDEVRAHQRKILAIPVPAGAT